VSGLGGFDIVKLNLPGLRIWCVGIWLCPMCVDDLDLEDRSAFRKGDTSTRKPNIVMVVF